MGHYSYTVLDKVFEIRIPGGADANVSLEGRK